MKLLIQSAALGVLVLFALSGCASPITSDPKVPEGATNAATITIESNQGRSGLIDVGTAASKSNTYDIFLYNANNMYRRYTTDISQPVVLTNIVPATYSVLVLAGRINGTTVKGNNAAVLLGSGDVPLVPNYASAPLTGPGITTSGISPTDGRGVTIAASGNTAISVTLQNIIYDITGAATTGTAQSAFVAGINNQFDIKFHYDLFLNQTTAAGGVVESPFMFANYGNNSNQFNIGGNNAPSFVASSFPQANGHEYNIVGTFQAPPTSGQGIISVASANAGFHYGEILFSNIFANTGGKPFSSITPQTGTGFDWYLPGDALSSAMQGVGVVGSAIINFSAPGAAVTVGWGTGR